MGTWGTNNFENDTAADWIIGFEENPTAVFLLETIQHVFNEDYLDTDISCEALAAIEVIAAVKKHPAVDFSELPTVDIDLLTPYIDQPLLNAAQKAIERITSEADNEIYELWKDSNNLGEWLAVQESLSQRLTAQ